MKITLPPHAVLMPLHSVSANTVVRFNREFYLVSRDRDRADTDFDTQSGEYDILCYCLTTHSIEPIKSTMQVEIMESSLTVSEKALPHHEHLTATEMDLVRAGNKIGAIKEVRARTGLGLADAKRIVDEVERTL
jgi:hypothetical protein